MGDEKKKILYGGEICGVGGFIEICSKELVMLVLAYCLKFKKKHTFRLFHVYLICKKQDTLVSTVAGKICNKILQQLF